MRGRDCKLTSVKHGTTYVSHGGAIARVYCHRGYKLRGSEFLACVSRQWNGTQPECLCEYPSKMPRNLSFEITATAITTPVSKSRPELTMLNSKAVKPINLCQTFVLVVFFSLSD